jgi:hypothetical protein
MRKKSKTSKKNDAGVESIKKDAFILGANSRLQAIVAAHSYIETGNYTSNIYRSCNNLFGMGRVYKRRTTQTGYKDFGTRVNEPRYMGCYSSNLSAIKDWFLWFEMWGKSIGDLNNMDLYDILKFMKSHKYFVIGLDTYYKRVKEIYVRIR